MVDPSRPPGGPSVPPTVRPAAVSRPEADSSRLTDLSRFRRTSAPRRRSTDLTTSLTGWILNRGAPRGTADTGMLPRRNLRAGSLLVLAVCVLIALGVTAVLITNSLLDQLLR